jgi:hypothetical protein
MKSNSNNPLYDIVQKAYEIARKAPSAVVLSAALLSPMMLPGCGRTSNYSWQTDAEIERMTIPEKGKQLARKIYNDPEKFYEERFKQFMTREEIDEEINKLSESEKAGLREKLSCIPKFNKASDLSFAHKMIIMSYECEKAAAYRK